MPSLKDLKTRIGSVKSTQKITKAMQLVAAAKLKRAQQAAEAAKPYARRMAAVIANLAAAAGADGSGPKLLSGTGLQRRHLLVVMTAERGLCGGFNSAIVKEARRQIADLRARGCEVSVLTVGRKGRDQLRREYADLLGDHVDTSGARDANGLAEIARTLGRDLTARFEAGAFDVCTLVHSQFRSVLSQVPQAMALIPAKAPEDAPALDLAGAIYSHEPSEEAILETLLPRYVNTQILSALLQAAAGEQAARMAAMDNATRNAGDMIKALSLKYNRARQAQITKELIEIISGAEAL
jgi:F-type H+-transporting ATPase subunit gamma